jgi:magnesium-transporting ATPase (P-type)
MGNKALRTMVMGHAELPFEWWSGKTGSDGRVTGGMEQKWNFLRSLPDAGDESKHDRGECAPACRVCGTLEEIERAAHMKLIGATCLEDRLQDLVPESIEDFLLAGVKVWMLTGDKLPTAKNIGMACNLIDPDMEKPEPQHKADKKDLSRLLSVTGRWAALAKDEKELNFLFGRLSASDAKDGSAMIAKEDLQAFLQRMAMPGMEDSDTKPEFFNKLWSDVDTNNDGKIDEAEFLKLMRSTKLTFWRAVQADLKGAWKRVQTIGEDSLYQLPVSLVIDGAAFNVLYPEKPPAKKAAPKTEGKAKAESKVAPNPNVGSAPSPASAVQLPSGAVQVAAKREESKSQLGGLVEKVESPPPEDLEAMRTDFFRVTSLCKSVVCCELTPAQKGAIVKQVQLRNVSILNRSFILFFDVH